MIHIDLDLSRHCIETEIKRLYNRSVSDFFQNKGGDEKLEIRIEMLQSVLNTYDFPSLRTIYKELCGNSTARIRLEGDGQHMPVLTINGRRVDNGRRFTKKTARPQRNNPNVSTVIN